MLIGNSTSNRVIRRKGDRVANHRSLDDIRQDMREVEDFVNNPYWRVWRAQMVEEFDAAMVTLRRLTPSVENLPSYAEAAARANLLEFVMEKTERELGMLAEEFKEAQDAEISDERGQHE